MAHNTTVFSLHHSRHCFLGTMCWHLPACLTGRSSWSDMVTRSRVDTKFTWAWPCKNETGNGNMSMRATPKHWHQYYEFNYSCGLICIPSQHKAHRQLKRSTKYTDVCFVISKRPNFINHLHGIAWKHWQMIITENLNGVMWKWWSWSMFRVIGDKWLDIK